MLFLWKISASCAAEDSMVTPDSQKAMVTLEGWSHLSILAFAPSSSCLCTLQHNHTWTSCAVFYASLWSSHGSFSQTCHHIAKGISQTWFKVNPSQLISLSPWHLTGIKHKTQHQYFHKKLHWQKVPTVLKACVLCQAKLRGLNYMILNLYTWGGRSENEITFAVQYPPLLAK